MIKYTQHSFAGGQLDRDLMGRQDLAKYFIGATTLKNLVVKRQGCLAKRRGTELVADLTGLFHDANGNATGDAIAAAITIPFVYTREGGYTLLIATPSDGTSLASGDTAQCFILSAQGILQRTELRLEDGTVVATSYGWDTRADVPNSSETAEEDDPNGKYQAGQVIYTIHSPFSLALPYKTDDLRGVTNTQSGDTLFLAHKDYPFAKIVRGASLADWTYEAIDFTDMGAAGTLYPPRILSATTSGQESDGAIKTVAYVATYVKDGMESAPSSPVYVDYHLPWSSEFKIALALDKGENAEEPDYYNIYKKSGGDYGFIGSTGQSVQSLSAVKPTDYGDLTPLYADVAPERLAYTQVVSSPKTVDNPYGLSKVTDNAGIFAGVTDGQITGGSWASGGARPSAMTTLTLPSGTLISGVKVWLDCFACSFYAGYTRGWLWNMRRANGKSIKVSLTVTDGTTTKTYTGAAPIPEYDASEPESQTKRNYPDDPIPKPSNWPRSVRVDLAESIDKDFPDGGAWCTKVEIGACAGADGTLADDGHYERLVISQVQLYGRAKDSNGFDDDYITPDVSITPPRNEPHFETSGDYPGCSAIYEQRLVLAATRNQPFTFWMSCAGDLYNFNTHASIREDDAIEATIPATEFPEINHMVMNKDLLLFCDNGEWVVAPVSGNTLSYKTIAIKLQSKIGCSKSLYPIIVGDEVVFAEATGRTLRASRYDFTSDGYQSTDLSVLSQDIFEGNPIVDMDYKQHPDSQIVCVLQDGTLATLSYMREHELAAWSVHTLGGGLKAIGVSSDKALRDGTTDTYLLARRDEADGERLLVLRIREDTEPTTVRKAVCLDAIEWVTATGETSIPEDKVAVDLITGEQTLALTPGRDYAFGYPFTATFRSVRPEAQGEQTIQFELKNATNAELRLLDASPVRVVPTALEEAAENQWRDAGPAVTPDAEGNLALGQHDVLVNLAGIAAEDGALTLRSETHWPLKILSFSVNYEFDPQHINQQG